MKWGLEGGGFQLMQILDLLGINFDAVAAEVKKNLFLFRFVEIMIKFYKMINSYLT